MFTGIVTATGRVARRFPEGERTVLEVDCPGWGGRLAPGDSVAVDGICLTVTRVAGPRFRMDLGAETLARTTAAGWRSGRRVNLERPLRLGDPLGGHVVQGHIDATVAIRSLRREAGGTRMSLELPSGLRPYVVERGSVALNGVSLTVAGIEGETLEVFLIPYTLEETNLGSLRVGERVNLELDPMGKYVARWMEATGAAPGRPEVETGFGWPAPSHGRGKG